MAKHQAGEGRHRASDQGIFEGAPLEAEMISTSEAALILGKHSRTMIRWVDEEKIGGGRPRHPVTGRVIPGSPRWVDAREAVALAVAAGRTHLIPERWHYLVEALQQADDGHSRPASPAA